MVPNMDEVVADSEDELSLFEEEPRNHATEVAGFPISDVIVGDSSKTGQQTPLSLPPIAVLPSTPNPSSTDHVEPFSTESIPPEKKKTHGELITDSIQSTSVAPTATSRPKPRQPQRKRKPTADQSITEPTAGSSTIEEFSTIPSKEISMLDDLEGFSLGVAERAKLGSRSRAAKTKQPVAHPDNVIILDSGSEDDDLLLASPPKKSKSKPVRKTTKNRSPVVNRFPDSTPLFPIPHATSDPNVSFGSPLPPSDLSPSSIPELPKSTPPDVLPNPHGDSPPPSPMPAARKRKQVAALVTALTDEDEVKVNKDTHIAYDNSDASMQPPPLRFSASSSDVLGTSPDVTASASSKDSSKRKRQPKDDGATVEGSPPKAKPKTKKKVVNDDEEDWNGDDVPKKKRVAKPKTKRQAKKTMVVEIPRLKSTSPTKAIAQNPPAEPPDKPSESSGRKDTGTAAANSESELTPIDSDGEISRLKQHGKAKKTSSKDKKSTNDSLPVDKASKPKGKSKRKAVVDSDEEGAEMAPLSPKRSKGKGKQVPDSNYGETEEENHEPMPMPELIQPPVPQTPTYSRPALPSSSTRTYTNPNRAYSIPKKSTPMSELLRKVNSQPGSPFPAIARPAFSPLAKTSKSTLRRIAPLHPNRRTPPPPLPRPPPPKKTKKQLELEEKWEMELEDSVEGWYCMTEEERAALRRAKRDAEMGFDD